MRESMAIYPITAMERAMKLQEVLLRANAKKIKWWQAAEFVGISERQMRRWRKRLEDEGPQGLLDRRRRKPSSRRVSKRQAEEVLGLYRDKYFDLNVRRTSAGKLGEEHQIRVELYMGQAGVAGNRPGEAQGSAQGSSQAA